MKKTINKNNVIIANQVELLNDSQDVKVGQFTTVLELYKLNKIKEATKIITSLHVTL